MLSRSESGEVDSLVFNSCSQSDLSGLEDLSHGAGYTASVRAGAGLGVRMCLLCTFTL